MAMSPRWLNTTTFSSASTSAAFSPLPTRNKTTTLLAIASCFTDFERSDLPPLTLAASRSILICRNIALLVKSSSAFATNEAPPIKDSVASK